MGETYIVELVEDKAELKSGDDTWKYTTANGLKIEAAGGLEEHGKVVELDYPGFMPEDQEIVFSADFKVTYPDGTEETKTETVSFFTKSLPNRLATSNISSVFPIPGMANFYKQEYNNPFPY